MGCIVFEVPGPPQGKERHRTVMTRGGKFRTYTPAKTVAYEKLVHTCFRIQWRKRALHLPLEGPIQVDVVAFFKIPVSTSKKKRKEMLEYEILPTVKPDVDNIEKAVYDGLSGFVYKDDKQICKNQTLKVYGEEPRVVVKIEWGINCDFGPPKWAERREWSIW